MDHRHDMGQGGEDRRRVAGDGRGRVGRRADTGSIRPAATRLVERHGAALLATARRYAPSPEDADDAYQRSLEILLAKAPDVPDEELLPWMKTVVKHEAFAIWRTRDRSVATPDEALERASSFEPPPEDRVASYERLRVGAEAIARLKPQEVRCLLLRAEGFSYRQICEATGWTYTKVNRCLTEGRRSFLQHVAGIESGSQCDRMAPLLSALADGEASPRDLKILRPHLRACSTCRATLRAYREVPRHTAALLPFVTAAVDGRAGPVSRWLEGALGWAHERASLVAMKVQAAFEGSSTAKLAAVAASAVAIAGGTLVVSSLEDVAPAKPPGGDDRGGQLGAIPPALLAGTAQGERNPPPGTALSDPLVPAGSEGAVQSEAASPPGAPVDPVAQQRSREVSSRPTTVPTDPGNPVRGPREREIDPMLTPVGGSGSGGSGPDEPSEPEPTPTPEPGSDPGDETTVDGGAPPPGS